MILNFLVMVGQWEREVTGERTRDAKRVQASRCETWGGTLPYGFDLDPRSAHHVTGKPFKLVPNAAEQRVIQMIRAWSADGLSFSQIKAILERRRIPTKLGHDTWGHTQIRRILKRPSNDWFSVLEAESAKWAKQNAGASPSPTTRGARRSHSCVPVPVA